MVFTMKILFVLIFSMIIVISLSKYVNISSLNEIRGIRFSELYSKILGDIFCC